MRLKFDNNNKKYKDEESKNSNQHEKKYKNMSYWIFAGLRIVLTLIPQTGYIHPDEYFQSIEVIAGDRFDIDVNKPWEFNATFPLRSSLIPQIIVGFPYTIINVLSPYLNHYFQYSLKNPYFLIVLPRLLICLLSFISDYCLYKICCIYSQNYRIRLVTYASSYVMIIYATRTLTNSAELILNCLLIYYVSRCMARSEKVVLQSDLFTERYDKAPNIVERVKYYKLRASLPSHSLNHCFILSTITIIGIFNRPTFVAFALPTIFFWLQRGLGSRTVGFWHFHIRIFMFIISGIPTIIFMILSDSFYYGYLTLGEISKLDIGMKNFVVTPVNFLKYNSATSNLAKHGLHSRWFHFIVNVPLLYNILGIIGFIIFIKMISSASRKRWLELPRIQSIESLMIACFIIPIGILSLFPHQEPRFIIPTLFPLVFLYAPIIGNNIKITNITSNNNTATYVYQRDKNSINKLQYLWWFFNFIMLCFYGFIHQGGIYQLTNHLVKELKAKPELTHVHLFTSYTYSIPTALLQLRNTKKTYYTSDKRRYKLKQDFFLYEQGDKNTSVVFNSIVKKLNECELKYEKQKIPYRLYYAIPVNYFHEFMEYAFINSTKKLNYQTTNVFYPHVSIEKLPSICLNLECFIIERPEVCLEKLTYNLSNFITQFIESFGLLLLRIELPHNSMQLS